MRSPHTRHDPWLSAAEIVAAQFSDQTSGLIKTGRGLVTSGRIAPRHISELASAIGTCEFMAGDRKRLRKMLDFALEDPTENTVAQAGWVSRQMSSVEVSPTLLEVPRAFEARAWESVKYGEFDASVALARDWFADEPFATRSVLFGSWLASTGLGDFRSSIAFVESRPDGQSGRSATTCDEALLPSVIQRYRQS